MEPSIFKLSVLVRALLFSFGTSTLLNLVNVKVATGADISQTCTRGFLSPTDFNHGQQLLPLLGLFGTTFGTEQWIFPELRFTCRGVVTKWIFKGQGIPQSSNCRARLSTWRLDRNFNTGSTAVYNRVSITDTSRARIIQQNGSVLTYEVATRGIHVQRNDIFGIEIESRSHVVSKLNVLGVRDTSRSVASRSYRRSGSGSIIFISPATRFESNYFPLVEAVMEQDELINIDTPFTNPKTEGASFTNSEKEEEVNAAATTTNGLYYDIVTLTNVTSTDTTDHDDQGSQNNMHTYMVGVITGGGVTFVLFVGVILCTCILLLRQRAKARRVLDQHNARTSSMYRCEGEFEGSNFSTTAMLMARNFAYSSSTCSQTKVDSVRRSCSTMMEENDAYNSQITDIFNELDGNSGGISMQANSAYTPVLGESQTLSASYKPNQQNETRGSKTEGDAYYDTIDSVSYFQGSVYGRAQSENSVVMEDDNKIMRDFENRNRRIEAAHQGRGRCDSMVDCDAYTYSYISDSQSDGYTTTVKTNTELYETVKPKLMTTMSRL